ncbi:CHAP domain-containing protein [Salinibacterium sp. ZJ70]|uniref:CHAP domain-containing protein n=1 Tax=Salinibacterium sp. ZJ70 TaxID=2708084 RepID=UPI00142376DC|nr:CHAP domain-containing protein [Salinibacterium sp. ZJ70]
MVDESPFGLPLLPLAPQASAAPQPVASAPESAPAPVHPVQYASRRSAREAASVPPAPPVAPFAAEHPVVPPVAEPAQRAPRFSGRGERRAARVERRSSQVRHPSRQRATAAGTMVLVGGLFVSVALPAYASGDYSPLSETAAESAAPVQAQMLAIDTEAAAAVAPEARDTFEAISPTQLRGLYRDALRQQNMTAYQASGARELGDDYPWYAELTKGQGGGLSPLNYYYRECVDFVVWRLNRDAGSTAAPFKYTWSNLTPGAGSARSWKRQWEQHGWEVSSTPQAGWVAWFPGGNHVSYVNSVLSDGSVLIEEYNWGPHLYGQRIIPASDALYLAPPPR